VRIVIFGTGGVGGYFGGRLAQAGAEVVFIARGEHLQALHTHGLMVDSLKGDFVIHPVQATDDPAEVGVVDVVLVAVKAWQVTQVAQAMRPLVGPKTYVVALQNGVEAPSQLAAVLGEAAVLGGFCRIVSYIVEPGHICQAGGDPYVAFGEMDNHPSDRVAQLQQAFQRTIGVTVETPPDIQAAMWGKFLLIASWSGMGAVTRAPVGVWRSLPETRQMWQQGMREVLAVAQARHIALAEEILQKAVAYVDTLPPHATASMQRDILNGRPSELDTLSGAVVRLGQEAEVPTPTHAFIYNTLKPLELKARGELEFPKLP
jgi:2-dehydropantoate 2-reductase